MFIVVSDAKQASSIGAAIFFSLPVVSLTLLWLAKTDNAYLLRRRSFSDLGHHHRLTGIGNIVLPKSGGNDWGSLGRSGFPALLAMTVYGKEEKRRVQQVQNNSKGNPQTSSNKYPKIKEINQKGDNIMAQGIELYADREPSHKVLGPSQQSFSFWYFFLVGGIAPRIPWDKNT